MLPLPQVSRKDCRLLVLLMMLMLMVIADCPLSMGFRG